MLYGWRLHNGLPPGTAAQIRRTPTLATHDVARCLRWHAIKLSPGTIVGHCGEVLAYTPGEELKALAHKILKIQNPLQRS